MTEKLLDFGKKAQGADVAVFFYAGHGIAIGGTNYLLPIDADVKSEMDVKLGAAINIDPATFTEESNQTTEDQIGLDKGQRRDVQRRLTGLGFDTRVSGKFDDSTRAVITRWQAARGYPKTGFLNKLQHKALLTEIVASTATSSSDDSNDRPSRRRSSGGGRRSGGGGGDPGAFIGGVMGGMFRH
jgi:hypothetical protein